MAGVDARELQDSTRSLLLRIDSGEPLTVTIDGRPATLLPTKGHRPRWNDRTEFATSTLARQADAALARELSGLAGEWADELPLGRGRNVRRRLP